VLQVRGAGFGVQAAGLEGLHVQALRVGCERTVFLHLGLAHLVGGHDEQFLGVGWVELEV